jgi:hypothetical protein
MSVNASPENFALLLGLSFFFGLAFEEYFGPASERIPGGVRTFPLLALTGAMLYLLEPAHAIAFAHSALNVLEEKIAGVNTRYFPRKG